MTAAKFQHIHIGQVWSVHDHHYGTRRYARVANTTSKVNEPPGLGDRVAVVNTETGRRTFMQASTLRDYWRLEREAPADDQQ